MKRRAFETTRAGRRAATAGPPPSLRAAAPASASRRGPHDPGSVEAPDWPRVIAALRGTDEDELPVFGRLPG